MADPIQPHVDSPALSEVPDARMRTTLRDRDERLRLILQSVRDYAIFMIDPAGVVMDWNAGAELVFGWPEAEIVGRAAEILWTPQDRAKGVPQAEMSTARQAGRAEAEGWLQRKDGSRFYASGVMVPTYDDDRRLRGFTKVSRDRTQARLATQAIKRADEAAERSRDQMEMVVAGANVGVWYCPLPFDRLVWDVKVKEHFHLAPDADVMIGTFYDRMHPDDRERTRSAIDGSVRLRQLYNIDYRTVSLDGEHVKWIRAIGRAYYDSAGDPIRFDGITVDETARKLAELERAASEEQLRLALAISQLGTFVIDLRTDVVTVNDRGREIYGWAIDESLTFARVQSHFHVDDYDRVMATVGAAMDPRGQGDFEVEQRIVRTDGEVRWLRVSGRAGFEGVGGQPMAVRFIGTYLDVTEAKLAETALRQSEANARQLAESESAARAEAERTSRMKDDFLATLSHELRTPLNAIVGWAQILRNGSITAEDLEEGLSTIDRNARAQTQIIEDLLDMSRIISGKIRLDVQRVDLAAIVQSAVDTLRPAADAKGIRVQTVFDPTTMPINGDPNRLQQVFWNLLSNAIKFTPKAGRVQVVLQRVNAHIEIGVSDTGEGIKPEFLPFVFDRFRQADATTTRRHGGLGLGLSIVKQLVDLHGGTVHVKSPGVGQGSTFNVQFPLMALHPEPDPEREHPRAPATLKEQHDACVSLDGVRVLAIDDEPDARVVLQRLLTDCGAVVETAGSVAEARQRLTNDRFDVVVSDIGMPNEDGYSLIRWLRSLPVDKGGQTPAVALTAYARTVDRMNALRAGYQMHAVKPIEPAELLLIVASLVGRRSE